MCLSFLSARDEFSSASIKPYCSVDRQVGGGGEEKNISFFLLCLYAVFTFVNAFSENYLNQVLG